MFKGGKLIYMTENYFMQGGAREVTHSMSVIDPVGFIFQ